jgi:hypothetical protein
MQMPAKIHHDEAAAAEAIITRGMEEARQRYAGANDALHLEGALEGFRACLGIDSAAIADLAQKAKASSLNAMNHDRTNYWRWRCRQLAIETVRDGLANDRGRIATKPEKGHESASGASRQLVPADDGQDRVPA